MRSKWPGRYSICQLSSAPISLRSLPAARAGPLFRAQLVDLRGDRKILEVGQTRAAPRAASPAAARRRARLAAGSILRVDRLAAPVPRRSPAALAPPRRSIAAGPPAARSTTSCSAPVPVADADSAGRDRRRASPAAARSAPSCASARCRAWSRSASAACNSAFSGAGSSGKDDRGSFRGSHINLDVAIRDMVTTHHRYFSVGKAEHFRGEASARAAPLHPAGRS